MFRSEAASPPPSFLKSVEEHPDSTAKMSSKPRLMPTPSEHQVRLCHGPDPSPNLTLRSCLYGSVTLDHAIVKDFKYDREEILIPQPSKYKHWLTRSIYQQSRSPRKTPERMTTPSLFVNAARRLSTPYQYHNAPEVIPASGLELNDPMEKHSDKIASISRGYRLSSMFNFKPSAEDPAKSKAPLILCNMKPRKFLLVSFVLICISVACLVGGILGNKAIKNNAPVSVDTTVP